MLRTFINRVSTIIRKRHPRTPEEFKALFERFKAVLESNNRSLEAITDMGEKLGGDYLFDIVYVRRAYQELRRDMEASLANFRELTRSSYPALEPVFTHIDSLITTALSEAPAGAGRNVFPLSEVPWGAVQAVGGKMAQVAELRNQLGLPVPDGFVITTSAFSEFIRFNRLEGLLQQVQQAAGPDAPVKELRERIMQGAIPLDLDTALRKALNRIAWKHGAGWLAVRSSAAEEDGDRSFAGQFKTLLGVPPDAGRVEQAYREVIASLFDDKALAYQEQTGYALGSMQMAVGCMAMVEAAASGVLYSTAPDGDPGTLLISAAWGLGESVVEGRTGSDLYTVRKGQEPELLEAKVGRKRSLIGVGPQGGTAEEAVPTATANDPCLNAGQVKALSLLGMRIERYFGGPRDIEWAIDKNGKPWVLQARPLLTDDRERRPLQNSGQEREDHPVLIRDRGIAVQHGAGAGKVFIVKRAADIQNIPKGAVLVAPHDSSLFVRSMPSLAAIITETGSQTSHMAALCRELRVPAVVNVPGVVRMLRQGQEVTLSVGDAGPVLYQGIVPQVLAAAGKDQPRMEELYEFRRKRYVLRYLSPLHLIDPLMDEFSPERCRTMHDVLRFMHEKAVAELIASGRSGDSRMRRAVIPLDLPVPAGIVVMDMGGGLERAQPSGNATFEQVRSVPFKALLAGMLHRGAWQSDAVAFNAGDLLSSMIRMPDITNGPTSTAGFNIAVISDEYVNMSIRFGYHFNMIDSFCSGKAKNNHIYFRFAGGATDLTKRSRRLDLISRILTEYGFGVKVKGDLLIARLAGLDREEMKKVLEHVGGLIAFARQLDAVLRDEQDVVLFTRKFMDLIAS